MKQTKDCNDKLRNEIMNCVLVDDPDLSDSDVFEIYESIMQTARKKAKAEKGFSKPSSRLLTEEEYNILKPYADEAVSDLRKNKGIMKQKTEALVTSKPKIANMRADYITWDEYFMGVAELSAMRSKDPDTQVGCCIVDPDNRIASVGYNGLPRGCEDSKYPWNRKAEGLDDADTKYPYVVHSELNAILNYKGESLKGCTMYVTMFPCNECAKAIIQSGIRKVFFREDAYRHKPSGKAADRMFASSGVKVERLPAKKDKFVKIRI